MSQPYPGTTTTPSQPPAAPYTQYPYQAQVPYVQYNPYSQGYAQQGYAQGSYYQHYHQYYAQHAQAQAAAAAQAPAKSQLPTLTLSNVANASAQQAVAHPAASSATAQTAIAPAARGSKKTQSLKGTFNKELRAMMYAFGDAKEPANDTVEVMEEILMEYLVDVCHTALVPTRKTRLQIEDLRRGLGRHADSKKLARLEELLFMQDDMRRARKLFSTEEKDLEEQAQVEP